MVTNQLKVTNRDQIADNRTKKTNLYFAPINTVQSCHLTMARTHSANRIVKHR